MINRELIRIKTVQLTYAYYQNGSKNIDAAEKELLFSLSKAYDMYNYLLELIVAITQEAAKHFSVAEAKARREGTKLPSARFVNNQLAMMLAGNSELNEITQQQNISWQEEPEFLKKIYTQISESQIYKDYMAADEASFEDDRELWRKLYRAFIEDNDDLDAIFEEKSLYWNDDKEIVDTFVLKTIKRFDIGNGYGQPLLPEYDNKEDREYARHLLRAAIMNGDEYQRHMSDASQNWDFSRLAYMDIVIMQIAIAEMLTFPSIPVSVTINEYVEIAKYYSTPRSAAYINGMLDAIAHKLADSGILLKAVGSHNRQE